MHACGKHYTQKLDCAKTIENASVLLTDKATRSQENYALAIEKRRVEGCHRGNKQKLKLTIKRLDELLSVKSAKEMAFGQCDKPARLIRSLLEHSLRYYAHQKLLWASVKT